jgi:hypothetical protein
MSEDQPEAFACVIVYRPQLAWLGLSLSSYCANKYRHVTDISCLVCE